MSPILVIEDDRDSRELLCELLQSQGFETVEAANGREGLACLEDTADLGLILLDLMMPEMNGWEFRRRQCRHPVHGKVPVVVVTADVRMNGRANELHAAELLTKPLDFARLLSTVRRLCAPPRGGSATLPA